MDLDSNGNELDKIIQFQIDRSVTNLSVSFLNILEELRDDLLKRGYNYNFDYNKLRKKVLDKNGQAKRELVAFINKFNLKLKGE
jgi:hypothetical protein